MLHKCHIFFQPDDSCQLQSTDKDIVVLREFLMSGKQPDQESRTVAFSLLTVMVNHGVREAIFTDQGRNFESQLIDDQCDLLDVHKLRTSLSYPECGGQTGRFNRTIESMLASFVQENQRNWDELLPIVTFTYRTASHKTTNFSRFELMYGRCPKFPCDLYLQGDAENTRSNPGSRASQLKLTF